MTNQRASLRYYWPGIYADIVNFVRQCDFWQRSKVEQAQPAGLMRKRIAEPPWTLVVSDVMGRFPYNKSSYTYVLVLQDLFTKCVEVVLIRIANEPTNKRQFKDLFVFIPLNWHTIFRQIQLRGSIAYWKRWSWPFSEMTIVIGNWICTFQICTANVSYQVKKRIMPLSCRTSYPGDLR